MTKQPPPRRRTKITHLTRRNATARYLAEKYHHLGTWQAVGDKIGISGGMAFRVAMQRYKPHDAAVRDRIKEAIAAEPGQRRPPPSGPGRERMRRDEQTNSCQC